MIHQGFDIEGKVALVTGGTSGLGRAIAEGYASAGARVYAGSRTISKVDEARCALKAHGVLNEALELDVSDPASVDAAVSRVMEEAGRIDIVVNAAGIMLRADAFDIDVEEWNRVLAINVTGTFLVCQAAGRAMRGQPEGGSIINIASLSSFVGLAWVTAYGMSKSAVLGITRSLAVEWAPSRIRVNAIAPGVFPTPLNRPLIEGTPRGQWFRNHTPMGRFGEASELVGGAIYLASDAASFVTGEILTIDGGFLACGVPGAPPEIQG